MTISFFWQAPTQGDGRYGNAALKRRAEREIGQSINHHVSDPRGTAFNYYDYLHQIARAVELVGFDGLRIPHHLQGEESWIVAGYLAPSTKKLQLLTEFEASRGSAVYAAKNAASFQRYTQGRFAWQLTHGLPQQQRRQQGDFVDSDLEISRIDEFLTVAQGVLTQHPFSFKGQFFEVLDGGFKGTLANQVVPPVYLSGTSEQALALSAKFADVHLFELTDASLLQSAIAHLQHLASVHQRRPKVGLVLDLIVRESLSEAQQDAQRYAQQTAYQGKITGHATGAEWWQSLTTETTGAKVTLVASYQQAIAILQAYIDLGIHHFQLSAVPHFEEAYRIGEHILPSLKQYLSPQSKAA